MNFLVPLFLITLITLTLGRLPVLVNKCPLPTDPGLHLTENSKAVQQIYNKYRKDINKDAKTSLNYMGEFQSSKLCKKPTSFPNDDPNKDKTSERPQLDFVQINTKGTCEPCPVRERFLGKFYAKCYVIAASQQQVRYVTCNKRCFAPCMCSRSYCRRTDYIRVWFFSYCFGSGFLPGGYKPGINFRYLWLPQDCTCVNV